MNTKNWFARVFSLVLTAVLLLTTLGGVPQATAAPTPLPELFIATSAPAALPAAPDASATRQAFVRLNLSALPAAQADFIPGTQVHLALFADAQFTARLDSRQASITGGLVYAGQLDGVTDSEVHLAVQDGVLGAPLPHRKAITACAA